MGYKVIYHVGEEVNLATKGRTGRLVLEDRQLVIEGDDRIVIPFGSIRSAELFRLHGTMRMIKIMHDDGVLFVSVVRVVLFGGYFAIGNFFANGRLNKELQALFGD